MTISRFLTSPSSRLFEGTAEEAREELAHRESEHTIVLSLPDKSVAETLGLASNLGPLVAVNSGPSVAACWTR
jgi:hypothetical protein